MRVALALAGSATHIGVFSRRGAPRWTLRYLDTAAACAAESGNARAVAFVRLMRGLAAYLHGDWKTTRAECDAAAAIFRESCTGVAWELMVSILPQYAGYQAKAGRDIPVVVVERA